MGEMPFTTEQFFQVFREYNQQVWPVQLLLVAVALLAVWGAQSGRRSRFVWLLVCLLWLWCGVAYHWIHFADVNPAAYVFGALFVAQAGLLALAAARGTAHFSFAPDPQGIAGGALMATAMILYPLIGLATGHEYMASPTFGLPCPLTIFTFGILLWARPHSPAYLLVVPGAWAVIGSSAFLAFGVWQDVLLPLAAVVAIGIRLLHRSAPAETDVARNRSPVPRRTQRTH